MFSLLELIAISILLIPGSIPFIIFSLSLFIKKCMDLIEVKVMV